ncbi:PilZ domain-containing protein [Sphingomonas sabuli]|uniref:PilZ domain-containing protein n=1 Tax=Sphingomonas sabuli TaxID=2764186 RepID=A0A7G9L4C3_9SPHN|nr:PilZ domain-containing protein [Sphingomonas sabuli]QNM83472.1 PilZ domain-containing protein [Sphingomonas sabuli]
MNQFRNDIVGKPAAELVVGRKRPRARGASGLSGLEVRRKESRRSDSRSGDRHRLVTESVTVLHKRRKYQVELINLSGGGAMIAGDLEPRLWDRIDVDFGETGQLEAAVRWVKNGRIGLEFAHETQIDCSREDQDTLVRRAVEQNFPEAAAELSKPRRVKPEEPADDPASRRETQRHPLIWSGTVTVNRQSAPVRIRNISARGALVQSDIKLVPGVLLLLDLGAAGSLAANVAWAFGDKAGLLFDTEFDVQRLASAAPKVAAVDWMCPDYLRNGSADLSASSWKRASLEDIVGSGRAGLAR